MCDEGEVQEAPVSVGREALVTKTGDNRFFFGWRSDPFFFDANGLFNKMQFTRDDFFADKNVCRIVLELPNSALATNVVGLWARTLDKTREGWIQADRGGRPLQAVFLPGEEREAYLNGAPADDDRFIGVWNIQAAIRRRTQSAWRESCCHTFFPMTLAARYPFRTMAGH